MKIEKKIVKSNSKSGQNKREQEIESEIKELSARIEAAGIKVRREKLKQGPGWKVMSGFCELENGRFVFVDRKNPLDDQLMYLKSVAQALPEGGYPDFDGVAADTSANQAGVMEVNVSL